MKKSTKIISGLVAMVAIVSGALAYGNAEMFQGNLITRPKVAPAPIATTIPMTQTVEPKTTYIQPIVTSDSRNDAGWTKVFSAIGTVNSSKVTFGSVRDLFLQSQNGSEFKIVQMTSSGDHNISMNCDFINFSNSKWNCNNDATSQFYTRSDINEGVSQPMHYLFSYSDQNKLVFYFTPSSTRMSHQRLDGSSATYTVYSR
jgi:hypothetical protein